MDAELCGLVARHFPAQARHTMVVPASTPHNQEVYIIGLNGHWRPEPSRSAMPRSAVVALKIATNDPSSLGGHGVHHDWIKAEALAPASAACLSVRGIFVQDRHSGLLLFD